MNKSLLILKREYLTRVRKKSFIIMTLLFPFLMAAMTILPAWLAMQDDKEERTIAVYDATGIFLGRLDGNEYTKFHYMPEEEYQKAKSDIKGSPYYAVLFIPPNILSSNRAQLFSDKQVTIDVKSMINDRLEKLIESDKKQRVIDESGIPDLEQQLAATHTNIKLDTIKVGENGETAKSSTEIAMGLGYLAGFIIYMFVLMYGMMVMRGVMEEKTNRIVEVIISSVKPMQLMFGKIVGIGLVGLTQILFWLIIGTAIVTGAKAFSGTGQVQAIETSQNLMTTPGITAAQPMQAEQQNAVMQAFDSLSNLNLPLIFGSFIFYFLGGFLIYSSIMGAIGSAVDQDEDSQQLMFPVMLPLIFSIVILFPVVKNPEGALAFWASMVPFTSPVIMMVRVPFGIPTWQLILSMSILAASIVGVIWIAGKIYRTGILMYGKKPNFKEIIKWLRYRN
ncbi:ABC transporter permease [Mangrovibacterium diazotrophicum]|uniref:ABC-2 type transport system permease protein n=1 Tax=Mangrovibacterium diazotrophicum TaxID=1261403 RepID=A0A419W7C3_9BACT|nr:ABC transporter permease [Mangrovibacterium diazotrophicum]RKD91373.1 ABC-2 type transport system permease protein [Mangrovibacterium diazotrophicum]